MSYIAATIAAWIVALLLQLGFCVGAAYFLYRARLCRQYQRVRQDSRDARQWLASLRKSRGLFYGAYCVCIVLVLLILAVRESLTIVVLNGKTVGWLWVLLIPLWLTGVFACFEAGAVLAIRAFERNHERDQANRNVHQ